MKVGDGKDRMDMGEGGRRNMRWAEEGRRNGEKGRRNGEEGTLTVVDVLKGRHGRRHV